MAGKALVPAAVFLIFLIFFVSFQTFAQTASLPDIAALEHELEAIRGLPFLKPVQAEAATPQTIHSFILKQFHQNVDVEAWEAGLRDFGFIPENFQPEQYFLKLLEGQVLAYYDPETKHFYCKTNIQLPQAPPDSPFSGTNLLDMTWLHELDHALQDQHFDLSNLEQIVAKKKNQDFGNAVDSLVEGDATLVMMYPMVQQYHLSPKILEQLGPLLQTLSTSGPELASAPVVFKEGLVLPYTAGMRFVAKLEDLGGWKLVNAAYQNLPKSTHQILHPEAYALHQELPVDFTFPDIPGVKIVADDVMGEMGVSILYKTFSKDKPVDFSGWEGDRYRIYRKNGGDIIVWVTKWKTRHAASIFFNVDSEILSRRFPKASFRFLSPAEEIQKSVPVNWIKQEGEIVYSVQNVLPGELEYWKKKAFQIREKATEQ